MLVLLTLMKSTQFYRGIGFWHNHKSNCNPIYVCVCAQCALSHLNQQSPKKNNTVRKNIQPLTVNTPNRIGASMAWYGLAYYGIVCFLYTLSEMKWQQNKLCIRKCLCLYRCLCWCVFETRLGTRNKNRTQRNEQPIWPSTSKANLWKIHLYGDE